MGWLQLNSWLMASLPALGGIGILCASFIDSSFVPLPLVTDLALFDLSSRHPVRMPFYVVMAALGSVAGHLPLSAAQMAERDSVCDEPVVILSARTASEHRRIEHTVAAARMPVGSHVVAEKSDHWIMQDEPELVISAIERVVELSRELVTDPA